MSRNVRSKGKGHHPSTNENHVAEPQQLKAQVTPIALNMALEGGHDTPRSKAAHLRPHQSQAILPLSTDTHSPRNRGYPRGDARCEGPTSIPRRMRKPPDPTQPVPARDLLPAMEVRGKCRCIPSSPASAKPLQRPDTLPGIQQPLTV